MLSVASFIFIIKENLDIASLLMTVLFVITDIFYFRKMKNVEEPLKARQKDSQLVPDTFT